jgi:hypothetical protein
MYVLAIGAAVPTWQLLTSVLGGEFAKSTLTVGPAGFVTVTVPPVLVTSDTVPEPGAPAGAVGGDLMTA